MQNPVTIVTAFFDIDRATKGDGRTIQDYLQWIQQTLKLNAQMFVVTEPKYASFFQAVRDPQYPMTLHIMDFKESHYYRYYDQIKNIIHSEDYRIKMSYPNRVECVLPEYNILQYSKFHYLQIAIEQNPYQSTYFLWMDAGASRFFESVNPSKPYPSEKGIEIIKHLGDHFLIQHRHDLFHTLIDESFLWKADNLLCGTMFGGTPIAIQRVAKSLEKVWIEKMITQNAVNNEQLGLVWVWKECPELFAVYPGSPHCHLILFSILA